MASGDLSRYWARAGQLMGFAVDAPYQVTFSDGFSIRFAARIPNFGAVQGMLLAERFDSFRTHADALVAMGYGYSVLSASAPEPEVENILPVLQDWGWSGSGAPPKWM